MDTTCTVQTGEAIYTTVTSNPDTVNNWIIGVNNTYQSHQTVVFGLDVEWKPNFRRGQNNPAATLQICVQNSCLIIQLRHISRSPDSLRFFLRNPRYYFAGVGIRSDADKLGQDYGLVVGNVYDVTNKAVEVSPERLSSRSPGLQELARVVAGFTMQKPRRVTMSDWGELVLTEDQIKYACLDAYASCWIGVTLFFGYDWA